MIEIKKKIRLTDVYAPELNNLYIFRVASKTEKEPRVIVNQVCDHLESELRLKSQLGELTAGKLNIVLKDLQILRSCPIVYVKKDLYENIIYYQIVVDLIEELIKGIDWSSYLYSLEANISGFTNSVHTEIAWKTPRTQLTDFIYSFSGMRLGRRSFPLLFMKANDEDFKHFILNYYKPRNHIAFSLEVDVDKKYQRKAQIQTTFKIYDNLDEAFEDKNRNTYFISQCDGLLGYMNFLNITDNRGEITFKVMYKNKPMLHWYKNTAIFFDGYKVLDEIKPYINNWANRFAQINLSQFCLNKDLFYQETMAPSQKKAVFIFVHKDKIDLGKSEIRCDDNGSSRMMGIIAYRPIKNGRLARIEFQIKGVTNNYWGTLVIPVSEECSHKKALEAIDNIISNNNYSVEAFLKYKDIMYENGQLNDPDTLSDWFQYCTKATKQIDDGIVRAYEQMKIKLENEYKQLNSYLNYYNFSQCQPVPKIEADKKTLENYYKTLHIDTKRIIINMINNQRINNITELQPTITMMLLNKTKAILKNDIPLSKFYNTKTNSISLLYKKLKGELLHDKVENRG